MLAVSGASVTFGGRPALDCLNLRVEAGEIVAVLGPSGCGKTTLLRVIAGLQELDEGTIEWAGSDLDSVPTHERDFGLMFQDHALFAHRSVAQNIAFGLRMRGEGKAQRAARVEQMLGLVGLERFGTRSIATLSGGEAQRVALARSLAPSPRLLMLDEPLGSLDRLLREELVGELRSVIREVGVTAIHVTHDHDEAFAVADRVAVMLHGTIARIGSAQEVWRDPRREDVARFLGHENIVTVSEGSMAPWGQLSIEAGLVALRPDAFVAFEGPAHPAHTDHVELEVVEVSFRGDRYELIGVTRPGEHRLRILDAAAAKVGERRTYAIDLRGVARLCPEETGPGSGGGEA